MYIHLNMLWSVLGRCKLQRVIRLIELTDPCYWQQSFALKSVSFESVLFFWLRSLIFIYRKWNVEKCVFFFWRNCFCVCRLINTIQARASRHIDGICWVCSKIETDNTLHLLTKTISLLRLRHWLSFLFIFFLFDCDECSLFVGWWSKNVHFFCGCSHLSA